MVNDGGYKPTPYIYIYILFLGCVVRVAVAAVGGGARQAAEDAPKEEPCSICLGTLPDTGRAIITCVSSRYLRT